MTESIESISDRIVYGDGYNPKKVDESIKVMARKLVCDVYAEQYQPRYLELVAAGHKDDEYEIELAVTTILAERQRTDWQPIETLPEKQSAILFVPDARRESDRVQIGSWGMTANRHKLFIMGGGARFGFDVGNPSHWMTIPSAPTLTDEATKARRKAALDELGEIDGGLLP